MKRKIYAILPLVAVTTLALASCSLEVNPPDDDGSSLVTAINYNDKQRIIYSLDDPYIAPDGQVYNKGDFKPFWKYVQNKLDIVLKEHAAAANSGEKKSVAYFRDNWLNKPYADITMGTVNAITKYAVSGNKETILDLKPYLDLTKFVKDEPGALVDESHKGVLPNLAKFLHDNPGVQTSIMTAKHSQANKGAYYFVPYFDGFNDNERSMMVRQDYITKLLDNDPDTGTVTFYDKNENIIGPAGSGAKYTLNYEPYIKDDKYKIMLPNVLKDGKITPGSTNSSYVYEKESPRNGNIIKQQNELFKKGTTSKELARQFQAYIKDRYSVGEGPDKMFEKPSDLFLGYKACFDTDELIALMRLVKCSSKTIYGASDDKEMVTWFPSEWTNMRSADLYRWAGQVFGVRGVDSRTGYLYFNGLNTFEGGFAPTEKIHDCRGDEQIVKLIKILQGLYKEGLLLQDFDSVTACGTNNKYFNEQLLLEYKKDADKPNKKYHGFMEYYEPSSESKYNDYTKELKPKSDKQTEAGTKFAPIIGAVTQWDTNGDGKLEKGIDPYMQFTESWISAKTSALCLNADLAHQDAKREAAFTLIDYIFSPEGKANYNFGPMEYGYYYEGTFSPDGNFELSTEGGKKAAAENRPGFIEYNGKKYPQYTAKALEEIRTVDGVNRERIGVTLPFGYERMNGLVFQQTRDAAQDSVRRINRAVECGTYKHTCISNILTEYKDDAFSQDFILNNLKDSPDKQPFYKIIPASFYLTDGQNTDIARILDKSKLGSIYTDANQSQFNIWDDYVMGKKAASAPEFDKYLETVNGPWECPKLVTYYQMAYELMV